MILQLSWMKVTQSKGYWSPWPTGPQIQWGMKQILTLKFWGNTEVGAVSAQSCTDLLLCLPEKFTVLKLLLFLDAFFPRNGQVWL